LREQGKDPNHVDFAEPMNDGQSPDEPDRIGSDRIDQSTAVQGEELTSKNVEAADGTNVTEEDDSSLNVTKANSNDTDATPEGNTEEKNKVNLANNGEGETNQENDDGQSGESNQKKDDPAADDEKEGMCCHLAACFVFIFPSDLQ